MYSDPLPIDEAIEDNDEDEVVVIDEQGTVYKSDAAPSQHIRKATILRDPEGEYGRSPLWQDCKSVQS